MFRLFAARKLRSISTRRVVHLIVHLIVLLSLLLGYAPAPLLAAPPDPEEPAIEEPAGLDQTGVDPQAGAAEYVEDPAREEEPAVPLTYEEIEAAGKEQELPTELSLPPEAEGVDSELFLEQTTNDATDVAEEAAIIEIGEELPNSEFVYGGDEPLLEVRELAANAFEEETQEELAEATEVQPAETLNLYVPFAASNLDQSLSPGEQRRLVPGTVEVASELEAAVLQALLNAPEIAPSIVDFAITDKSSIGDRYLISVIGLAGTYTGADWNLIDNGVWFGLVIVESKNDFQVGAVEGTNSFSQMLEAIPDQMLSAEAKQSLDPIVRASAVQSYAFPWESGFSMNYGAKEAVHDNGFCGVTGSCWLAVDLLSDGNTGAGHAPNRLLAAASGSIGYKCTPKSGEASTAIRIGDLMYTHLLNSGSIYSGRWVSQGEELGQMKSGNFTEDCGHATQGDSWFHVHLGFPSSNPLQLGSWSLNVGDQRWYNGSESRGPGDWLQADGGSPPPSNCQNYSYNGVVLFENKECNGEKREYGNAMTGVENLPGVGWNDRTSSVHVASGWSVRVWEHESSGGTRCLTNSMWDLSKDYYEGSGTLIDETITSVKVFNNGSCSDSTPSGRARLYSEPNWKGSVVWEGGTGFSNDPSANSYSMDLPDGWSAITYRGDNGGEPKRCWSADVANFQDHEDWQSKTQSIEVFDHDACPKPPADPSNLNISGATETSLTLTWQDNSGDENNFNIYKWDGVDFPYLVSVGANTTSYTDSGLNCGSPYFYKVSAYNGAGESNRVGFITGYTSDCSTPSTPSLASPDNGAVYDEGQSVVLSWNSANATEYYGEITGGPSALSFGWQGDTYADLGPQWAGYHYTWRVKARRGDQQSDWSESRTFTVRPGAPTNLSASSPSCGKVDLTWGDGSGNEDGYRIYRNGNAVAVVGADVTGFTQSSLPAGTHTYKVHAYHGAVQSPASNETQVTVNQCVPAAKLGTTVTPATQVHNGVTRIATRFTLRESAGAPVNIQNYSYRWYSADGKEAFGAATTPAAISLNLPAGGSANWSIGLQLPRWVAQMAADRGDTAVRLYMTFRGVDSVDRAVKTGVYVTLGMAACSDATEPNNARGKARTITYGQTLNSVMCPAGELDLFTFSGTAGERIRIAARPRSGVDALNPKLELLRRDGAVLATNDNRAAGLWDARIGIVLPATDKYYIRVTDTKRRGGPQQGYQILLHQDSVQPVAAIRALAGGTWLHAKQQVIRVDASDRQTEIDHITFYARLPGSSALKLIGADYTAGDGWRMTWDTSKLPAGAGYGIIIRAVDGAGNYRDVGKYNLKLERTPPTVKAAVSASYGDAPFRAFVVKWNNGRDAGSGLLSYDIQVRKGTSGAWTNWVTNTTLAQARYLGADDQTYYFRARARDKAGNVSAYASGAGDTRYTVNVCPVAKDGYETDDSAAAAKAVRSDGSRYSHNFHAEGNVDWMKFTAAAGATYVLRTYMVGKHADTVLTLYKSDGKTVLASNDDLSDATYASRITWQAPAYGTYYLQVKHYDKYGFGCTTGYNVAVTKQAAASSGLENGAGDPAGNPTDNVVDGEPALPGDLPPLEDEGDQPPAGDAVEQFFQLFLPLTQR